jgi:hypothetical protein
MRGLYKKQQFKNDPLRFYTKYQGFIFITLFRLLAVLTG